MLPDRSALPFSKLDVLHRRNLDVILDDFGLHGVDEPTRVQLSLAWHRLDAWPDVAEGLARLRRRFLLAPCSNGNISLMVDLARRNGLVWDAILGAELARDYKPKAVVYLAAAAAFDCEPAQVMMVAAHSSDLEAAAAAGLRTAFVARCDEYGPGRGEGAATVPVDMSIADLLDLADRLGADDPHDLQRFVQAQDPVYAQVCAELAAGAKTRHWMWFVFPQLKGLGRSAAARHFGIASRTEAQAYRHHPLLGPRLKECSELVLAVAGRTALQIFGSPDDLKFRSSMTLFAHVAPEEPVFRRALEKYFGASMDERTLALL